MKELDAISNTFSTIRQLPVEVSFMQVEKWVMEKPLKTQKNNRWLPLLLAKFLFPQSKN